MDSNCGLPGINKRVLYAGKGDVPSFVDGTKVTFHYQTRLCDDDRTVLDDSKKDKKTMELIMGKKFKFDVWETCLKTMRMNEVASFIVHKHLAMPYPPVAKSLRDIRGGKSGHGHAHHCCGMSLQDQGLGYDDLNKLMKNPEDLEFILDVENIENPEDFKKETWCMDENEKLDLVPKLQDEGNRFYMNKDPVNAAAKYGEALGLLEQLLLREKPGDEEYIKLDDRKVPLLLNFAQCKLLQEDYYAVIEHTTEVLKNHPDNVKALYRRAKAHVGAWNPLEAIEDYNRVTELDPSLEKTVSKELRAIAESQKKKNQDDREKLQGKMFK